MKFDNDSRNIADCIYSDYIVGNDLNSMKHIVDSIPLLIDNGLAHVISSTSNLEYSGSSMYRVACKFIAKYNKSLKSYRRKPDPYEFGGEKNLYAGVDPKLIELVKYGLYNGTYMAQLDKSSYMVVIIDSTNDEYGIYVKTDIYFIGDKWKKWKDKFYKMVDEYDKLQSYEQKNTIHYTDDSRSTVSTVFKGFDYVIINADNDITKADILKYIDNWKRNIPKYYSYGIIPKLSVLVYGEPGTGKSTMAKAIAKYLDIPTIMSVSPSYFKDDNKTTKRRALKAVHVLDDIDCVCKSREESDNAENAEALSNLLSFLDNPPSFDFIADDGIKYPVSIVVATTNYYDKLDYAVKRHGRFDLHIHMKEFDKNSAVEMCTLYDLKLEDIVPDSDKKNFKIQPSKLQALCMENIDKAMKQV